MPRPSLRKALMRVGRIASLGSFPVITFFVGVGCPDYGMQPAYGPQPEYGVQDCDNFPPAACIDDQECIDEYGEGWYCDEEALWFDGCDEYEHPQCVDGNE